MWKKLLIKKVGNSQLVEVEVPLNTKTTIENGKIEAIRNNNSTANIIVELYSYDADDKEKKEPIY